MLSKFFGMLLPLMVLSVLIGVNTSCTYFSPLVGKWKDSQSQNTIEFTRSGNVIISSNGSLISGTYQLISSGVVKLNFEGLSGDMLSAFGADTLQYSISGNTMTLEGAGSSDVFYRVENVNTSKEATINPNKQPSIKVTYPSGGETFHVGQTVNITWKASNLPQDANISIDISNDSMNRVALPLAGQHGGVPNTGSYKWVVTSSYVSVPDMGIPSNWNTSYIGTHMRIRVSWGSWSNGNLVGYADTPDFTITK